MTPPGIKQQSTSSKYVDDLTIATVIKLKNDLEKSEDLPRPLTYRSRTGHILPENKNPMNLQLNNVSEFAEINQMKINQTKTKVMLFNRATSLDFQPSIHIENSLLDVVEETKLLGVIVSSNLKWSKHVNYIRRKCFAKMWGIRRIKELGASIKDMLEVYIRQIRCLAETGCPAWNGSLTQKDVDGLESIQRTVVKIILGNKFNSYRNGLTELNLSPLKIRREKICLKFAKCTEKSKKFSKWFQKTPHSTRTRTKSKKYLVPSTRTKTYEKSPLFYLTNLLNN